MADTNRNAVDFWTLAHAAAGVAAAKVGVPAPLAIAGAIAYEVVEPVVWPVIAKRRSRESTGNRIVDVLAFTAGFAVVKAPR